MYTFDRVAIKEEAKRLLNQNRSPMVVAVLVIYLVNIAVAAISAGILGVLVSGLLTVALNGFFVHMWRSENDIVSGMIADNLNEGALRKIGGMLWMQLKVFLWTLLLFVPGIIKSYSYFLTPYILAEHPNVPAMEASRLSEKMMQGHRTEVFITQMSFLGWAFVSALTMNVLYVLHVGPYMQLTYAGIYDEIKRISLEEGIITTADLEGGSAV